MKGAIDLAVAGNNAMTQKVVVFKNNAPFMAFMSKLNNTFIDHA